MRGKAPAANRLATFGVYGAGPAGRSTPRAPGEHRRDDPTVTSGSGCSPAGTSHVPRRGAGATEAECVRTQQIYCVHCQALSDVADLAARHAALGTADLRSVSREPRRQTLVGGTPFAICRHEPRHGRPKHRPGPGVPRGTPTKEAWLCLTPPEGIRMVERDSCMRPRCTVLVHLGTVGTYLPPGAAACVALIGARSLLPVPRGTSLRQRDPSAPPRPGRVSRELHDGGPAMSSRSAISPVPSERAAQSVAKPRSASSGPPLASEYARSESQGCTRTRTSPARLLPGSAFCRGRVGHHGPEPAWNQRSRLDRLSRRRRTA